MKLDREVFSDTEKGRFSRPLKRREAGSISPNTDNNEENLSAVCPNCCEFGFNVMLEPRIYSPDQPIPTDADKWLQCRQCLSIVARINAVYKDNEITGIIPVTNPYDKGNVTVLPVHDHDDRKKKKIQKS